eukprot:SAG31_NODE_1742_length_7385_cov_40.678836_6_plen_156_part_00
MDAQQVTALLPIIWSFLPDGLVDEVHMKDSKTVAAIRQLTVLFVKLKGIALGGEAVDQMQQTLIVMQTAIIGHGGFIKEFSVDDKVRHQFQTLGLMFVILDLFSQCASLIPIFTDSVCVDALLSLITNMSFCSFQGLCVCRGLQHDFVRQHELCV